MGNPQFESEFTQPLFSDDKSEAEMEGDQNEMANEIPTLFTVSEINQPEGGGAIPEENEVQK